jgi:hypothetical protein
MNANAVNRRLFRFGAVALLIGLAFVVVGVGAVAAPRGKGAVKESPKQAQDRVQHADGSPKEGFDPAKQKHTSLAEAAGKANSNGGVNSDAAGVNDATKKQATNVKMNKRDIKPAEVLPKAGVLVNGCVAGYGGGASCLPTPPPGKKWTCEKVRLVLPAGIAVTGKDSLKLDSNKDKIACGPGDTRN